jgi:hypothetical protein
VRPLRIVVVGTLAANPYAGMAWTHMQLAAGLRRLGHDVYYYEITSDWPYDPIRRSKVGDSTYPVTYLARVAESFGLGDRWAYRRSYADGEWFGLPKGRAEDFLAHADMALNVAGATRMAREDLKVSRWVYFGTDPVCHEVTYAAGNEYIRRLINEHTDVVTYGENIGTPHCQIPPLPRLRSRTRQPVLLDLWRAGPPPREHFTTVANWKQIGRDVEYCGEVYYWSKNREFLKIIDLPRLTDQPIEVALNLADREPVRSDGNEAVPAFGACTAARRRLELNGWELVDACSFTTDPWPYREYIRASRGELTVARDLNVRLRSGWFSERSACYLAAGRPVVTQDTGFGTVLPTGEGLFAFSTTDEAVAAIEAVNADYRRHSRAARAIAEEYFRAERVLGKLLQDLGL